MQRSSSFCLANNVNNVICWCRVLAVWTTDVWFLQCNGCSCVHCVYFTHSLHLHWQVSTTNNFVQVQNTKTQFFYDPQLVVCLLKIFLLISFVSRRSHSSMNLILFCKIYFLRKIASLLVLVDIFDDFKIALSVQINLEMISLVVGKIIL